MGTTMATSTETKKGTSGALVLYWPLILGACAFIGLVFQIGQWVQETRGQKEAIEKLEEDMDELKLNLLNAKSEKSDLQSRVDEQTKLLDVTNEAKKQLSETVTTLEEMLKGQEELRERLNGSDNDLKIAQATIASLKENVMERETRLAENTLKLEAATRSLVRLETKWRSDDDIVRRDFPDFITNASSGPDIAVATLNDPTKSDAEKFAASRLLIADQDPRFVDAIKRIIDGGDASAEMRQFAANSFDRLTGHPDAESVLIRLVDNKDQKTVSLAITSLGAFKSGKGAREALETVLGDDGRSWDHRGAAATSLYRIGSEEATGPLIAAAREGLGAIRQDPTDVEVQEAVGAIATALGQLPASESHDVLVELLLEERVSSSTRAAAVTALVYVPGSAGKKEVVDALLKSLQSAETDIRGTAVTAVGQLAIPASVDLLIDILLTDDKLDIGGAAATALHYVVLRTPSGLPADQQGKIVQALVAAVESRPRNIRGGAVTSLGRLKSTIAVPVLTKLCLDENEATDIRRAAVTSLNVIAGDSPERMDELAATLSDMLTTEKELPASP
jgi:HEAT repeat protein